MCVLVCALAGTPPILAGMCGVDVLVQVWLSPCEYWLGHWALCVGVRPLPVPHHSWLGCAVWVCVLGLGFGCAPPFLAECVGLCVLVCTLRSYPALTGRGLWCVRLGWHFVFHPAYTGWGVGVCVFVCALRPYPAGPG